MRLIDVLPFLARAATTAVVVVLASMVAEVSGPVLGALAASLPVSAGPTYIFLALTHDVHFVSATALGSFAANAATMAFLAMYTCTGMGRSRLTSMVPALLVWLVSAFIIKTVIWTATSALILNAVVFLTATLLTRRLVRISKAIRVKAKPQDVALRALVVAVFVAAVLGISAALGPSATGIVAAFPIVFVLLIFMLQPRLGNAACVTLAATAIRAMGGFGLMFLTAHLAVVRFGAAAGFTLALVPTLLWSAALALNHIRASDGV